MDGAYSEAASAEKLGQKVQTTWHDAIFNDNGATVAGKQYGDFNDAIEALINSETSLTSKISDGRGSMTTGMNTMSKNVTYDTKSKLETALKIATKVEKFASMTTSPSGSYQTYGADLSELDSDAADLISTGFDKE
ncbi:hypothetical protein [Lacticaseibacillus sp. N501-2]|uniref:hypothetical protein n=1 Tax=Lacticaseibacillus salsurae TaxID=3367729 RepID=UPI0038B40C8A